VTIVVKVVSVLTEIISPSNAGFGRVIVQVVGAAPVQNNVLLAFVAKVVKAPEPENRLIAVPFLTRFMQRN
jgi:hypothetical protein